MGFLIALLEGLALCASTIWTLEERRFSSFYNIAMVTIFSSISTRKLSNALTVLTSNQNMVAMSDYGDFHMMVKHYILTSVLGANVQFSSSFLEGISEHVDPKMPFISHSKGLELNTLRTMSQIIPKALGNPSQPFVTLSGPSFALELMRKLPTAMVVASKDKSWQVLLSS